MNVVIVPTSSRIKHVASQSVYEVINSCKKVTVSVIFELQHTTLFSMAFLPSQSVEELNPCPLWFFQSLLSRSSPRIRICLCQKEGTRESRIYVDILSVQETDQLTSINFQHIWSLAEFHLIPCMVSLHRPPTINRTSTDSLYMD